MTPLLRPTAVFAFFGLFLATVTHAQHTAIPAGMSHDEHMAQMKKDAEMKQHGNLAMGFDQDKTTHHFNLTADGGSIAVEANDSSDRASLDQIRVHLKEIAIAFGQGDFQRPFMTHSEVPPGVPVMQRLKTEIAYTFEESARGGIVRISTANAEARVALHAFLTYQIKEHATGDPVSLQNAPGHVPDHSAPDGWYTRHIRGPGRSLRSPLRQRQRVGEEFRRPRARRMADACAGHRRAATEVRAARR